MIRDGMPGATWLARHRSALWTLAIYVFVTAVYGLCAAPEVWTEHTRYNHFAWLADGFLHGRLQLAGAPPAYAGGNDFARFENHWYVVFPPFPALLLMPWLACVKSVDALRDGAFFLMLAGVAPAAQFWGLERLHRAKLTVLGERARVTLALLFAFGTVYFFTAVQGTVWFAAHVVTTSALSIFLAASIGAQYPWIAGIALVAVIGTRTHLGLAGIFFLIEAVRVTRVPGKSGIHANDWRQLFMRLLPVAALAACAYGALLWYNWARFHDAFEVGYRFLQIAWRQRIERWGMFSYHYLARNLGIVLTSLPYLGVTPKLAPFQINGHGLALWFTTPLYLWLLWPRRRTPVNVACYATLVVTAIPSLLYQNSGWVQFGQRFSNDYSPVLFLLLALGIERFGTLFKLAAVWSVAVNLFGALTFQRPQARAFYYTDPTQRTIYEPD
jgi:hypothetical protein